MESANKLIKKLIILIHSILDRPERLFLFISIIFGLLFSILVMPFRAPDEHMHFYRAYHISEGKILASQRGDKLGDELPNSLKNLVLHYNKTEDPYVGTPPKILLKHDTLKFLKLKLFPSDKSFYDFSSTAPRGPLAYSFASLGILIGRVLNLPLLGIYFFGRIFNLALYIILMYFAIRFIPKYKYILLSVGLFPATIFLASTYSLDGVIMGSILLFTSCCLRLYKNDKKVSLFDLFVLGLPLILIGTSKFVYLTIVVLLLPLILDKKNKVTRLRLLMMLTVVFALSVTWFLAAKSNLSLSAVSMKINPKQQVKNIIRQPLYFINATNNTIFTDERVYTGGMVGHLDWSSVSAPLFVVIINYILLGYSTIYREESEFRLGRKKALLVGVSLLTVYIIFAMLFITWNVPDTNYALIAGVQPRYLFPLLPLLLIPINNDRFYIKSNNRVFSVVASAVIILSLWLTLVTLNRLYYIQ